MIDTAAYIIGVILSIGGILTAASIVLMLVILPFAWLANERKLWKPAPVAPIRKTIKNINDWGDDGRRI